MNRVNPLPLSVFNVRPSGRLFVLQTDAHVQSKDNEAGASRRSCLCKTSPPVGTLNFALRSEVYTTNNSGGLCGRASRTPPPVVLAACRVRGGSPEAQDATKRRRFLIAVVVCERLVSVCSSRPLGRRLRCVGTCQAGR